MVAAGFLISLLLSEVTGKVTQRNIVSLVSDNEKLYVGTL